MTSTKEYDEYIQKLETAYEQEKTQRENYEVQMGKQSSMYGDNQDTNLIQWQLELDNILERIDHLLRGHTLEFDKDGNLLWQEPKDENQVIMNEYGVQEILRILSLYLNRNTILSNYSEETISDKVYDFAMEVSDLLYMKYEDFGLVTESKRKLYPIIIRMLVDVIHSAYLRAYNGGERQSLREARHVSENLSPQSQMPFQQSRTSTFNVFKPKTWTGK